MKKILIALSVIAVAGIAVFAAQDTSLTEKELRDPKQLRPWLVANATDAETRLGAAEIANPSTYTNSVSTGSFQTLGGTNLVFISAGSVTNVIDADTSTP